MNMANFKQLQTIFHGFYRLGGEQECGGEEDPAGGEDEKEKGEESGKVILFGLNWEIH